MATKKKAANRSPRSGGFLAGIVAFLTSPTFKSIATVLLSMLAGGATVGYVANRAVKDAIPELPLPRIPKLRPPLFKPGDAIGQTRFGNAGCSATIIGPVGDQDAHVDILTAAHCMGLHAKGTMKLKDGRVLDVQCISRDAKADVAWLRAKRPDGALPWLEMIDTAPPPGTKIWHMGYGVDKPGNKEDGHVTGTTPDNLKVQYRLSVSPGDSGGGIITTSDNKVISPVCCTTRLGGVGDVWGGTPAAAARIRPSRSATFDEPPVEHPLRLFDDDCPDCEYFFTYPKRLPLGNELRDHS